MDNQTTETIDPWANMGNMGPQRPQNNEVSAENLKRAEEWNQAMQDPPAFSGEMQSQPVAPAEAPAGVSAEAPVSTLVETPVEAPAQLPADGEQRDESIAEAEAILFQGPINAAAREKGIDTVVQGINNFVYSGQGDPMKQLLTEIGVDNKQDKQELAEEAQAIKPAETAFREENINAPTVTKKSEENTLGAIKEFKELIAEVESSPDYAGLRANAIKNGKSLWGEAVSEYGVRDLTTLFDALGKQKEKPTSPEIPSPEAPSPDMPSLEAPSLEAPSLETPPVETLPLEMPSPETEEKLTLENLEATPTPTPQVINQATNQSSTENLSPETDATATTGF
jgi:hypothetical protein